MPLKITNEIMPGHPRSIRSRKSISGEFQRITRVGRDVDVSTNVSFMDLSGCRYVFWLLVTSA
jgi:hypothetical protein